MNQLQKINWDFSDFISTKYPLDMNSIPWYPATFISPIPKLLVASLSKQGDVVLDPFGGKGTTAIETALQNRIPLYNDLNPFASETVSGLFAVLEYVLNGENGLENVRERILKNLPEESMIDDVICKHDINPEVKDWFHEKTILTLLAIVETLKRNGENKREFLIGKLAFSSMLKSASSQQGHFTYVTDNCKPTHMREKDALSLYCDKIEQIFMAAREFIIQYKLAYPEADLRDVLNKRQIVTGNAKNMSWISDESVDLVITSPPYLCSQDYIKTMRLMNLFFENKAAFKTDVKQEIGARSARQGKSEIVVPKFYSDMRVVFTNIKRVLKKNSYFCLVIGQGKSKITSEYDIISDLIEIIKNEYDFKLIFRQERQIGSRVIKVGGVDKESVLIFEKTR